ncbi:UDP-Glycosyltransferase/glycogen phosphorylase [Mycena latifolia]|nr:UDP-Glycosyltransferase/glycogen phosphorylase [Mycena latifolia]
MPPPDARHLLLVAFPAWGHTRPLCVLGGRLAAEAPDIVITILMAPNWLEKARVEIATQFPVALERIRHVYPGAYEAVFRGEAITCAVTGTTFSALPPPTAIIMDFFVSVQLHQTRAISGTAVPIFAFASCGSAALIRLFAPKALGGLGDFGARTDAEARRTGESVTEVGDRIFKHTDGTVVHVAGIPPMFDYEFFPQKLPWDVPMAPIVRAGHEMFTKSDGIFIRTCAAYDGEALSALEGWLTGGLGKPLYAVGPLLPPGSSAGDAGEGDGEIRAFLDAALARYGEKSTLLISFGTIFWPTVPAHLDALVDTLIEKNFPFILCHASPFAAISTALREKIERGGLGLFTRWCPQQFVLSHPATGWFMTHGGHGGINEALSNGVPLICWPFDGDQPAAAVLLSQTLDAAFHLVQVRTGASGLRPLFCGEVPRGGAAVGAEFRSVTDACRGPEGERKRVNARKLQAAFGEAWGEGVGGTARTAVRAFVERWMRG